LLEIRRQEIREYVRSLNQGWREDASNADVSFSRNRVRAHVLPLLREEINPSVDRTLAHTAEISRAEEEYWQNQMARLLPLVVFRGDPARDVGRSETSAQAVSLDIQKFQQYPLAVQRRLLRSTGDQLGCGLDFDHVQAILDLLRSRTAKGGPNKTVEIASGWRARLLFRELRLERANREVEHSDYEHALSVPGEVHLPELGIFIRARIREGNGAGENAAYNRAHSIRLPEVTSDLIVRNWRPGDRFQPLRHRSEKRLKELLYPLHLQQQEKRLWPVVVLGEQIVWVRGVDSPELRTQTGQQLFIEESSE
jgi:tRNA(Ile)-lysidine synthase